MKFGPKQVQAVAKYGFQNGGHVFHLGNILIAIPSRQKIVDPAGWDETLAPAPTLNPEWRRKAEAAQETNASK